jgi:hypothetical protein
MMNISMPSMCGCGLSSDEVDGCDEMDWNLLNLEKVLM